MQKTSTILDTILASKRLSLEEKKKRLPLEELEQQIKNMSRRETVSLYDAIKSNETKFRCIAEIKKASPSAGVLREQFSVEKINEAYQLASEVVAISVITETDYFHGSDEFLATVANHNTHHKPILRKDFIFDTYQILESKLLGADAFLLIAALFNTSELDRLVTFGQSIGLEPLVEVHSLAELKQATSTSARCIGVNSRNLKTFSIDSTIHELLRTLIPCMPESQSLE